MKGEPDEDIRRPGPLGDIVIPRDLSRLSVGELEALIATLEGEIGRLKAAVDAKQSTRSAADAVFRR